MITRLRVTINASNYKVNASDYKVVNYFSFILISRIDLMVVLVFFYPLYLALSIYPIRNASRFMTKTIALVLFCISVTACNTLPKNPHIQASLKLNERIQQRYSSEIKPEDIDEKRLALTQSIDHLNNLHSGLSGYHPIISGTDAFVYRNILTSMAVKTIDVQYYIWHNDETGQLMLKELWKAAENGVIVRFLLDDFNSNSQLDQHLLQFASHPNIAVRLVNPMAYRKFKTLNYLSSLKRINRRMHNKSITFDRQLSIVGGRNIGNEYLSNNESNQFADIDVLLVGPVVKSISNSFDEYWNASVSYDVQTLVNPDLELAENSVQQDTFFSNLDKLDPNNTSTVLSIAETYKHALNESTIDIDLINKTLAFRWAPITFVSDNAEKISRNANPNDFLVHKLRNLLGKPNKNLTIVSSYFVPTKDGVDTLTKLSKQGVKIRILTNSYHATDVSAVHAGYSEWRKTLLKSGVELYEIKATVTNDVDNKLWRGRSQSSTSLHAKMLAVDDRSVFIGSYNVDPRSADMNTEMGVIIEDSSLANTLHQTVSDELFSQAYKVILTDDNNLQWQTLENNEIIESHKEPNMGLADLIWIKLMSLLPIDWLL